MKGVEGRRARANQGSQVLFDADLMDRIDVDPLLVPEPQLRDLRARLEEDTAFLVSINVMDYSLLCRLRYDTSTVRVGIIDYLGDFTVEKRLESQLKKGLVGEHMTTVVEPARYATRFVDRVCSLYFAAVPSTET